MKSLGKNGFALFVLMCVATAGIVFGCGSSADAAEPTWEDVQAEADQGGYRLITTNELWERYREGGDDILLVDTRQGWEYRTGHITGAESFPMEPTMWSRWKNRGPLRKLLGEDREKLLVFY